MIKLASTVQIALDALGFDETFLRRVLIAVGGTSALDRKGRWRLESLSIDEWFWICNILYLPMDSLTLGYFRQTQRAWAGKAIQQGRYVLPRTRAVEQLFREYICIRRQEVAFELGHTGDPLRARLKKRRYEASIQQRIERKQNMERLAPVRNALQQIYDGHSGHGLTVSGLTKQTGLTAFIA